MAGNAHILHNIWFLSATILGIVVLAKVIAKKTATVDVLWLIILGSIFSNIGVLPSHNVVLEYIGEWGIVFIMFALGFDEEIEHFKSGMRRSIGVAIIGAIFPFAAGYLCAILFGYSEAIAMMWGLTMTATAVSLTMVSLKEKGLHRSTAATGIMTAAVIDDILSLIGIAILVPVALSAANSQSGMVFDPISLLWTLLKVVLFFGIILSIGILAFPEKVPPKLPDNPTLLQRIDYFMIDFFLTFHIRKFLTLYHGEFTPLLMIFIAMASGALADLFGFHPAIGAYMAGLFLKKDYFLFDDQSVKDRQYYDSKLVIEQVAFTIFGPIFFVNLGAKIVLDPSIFASVFGHAIILFAAVASTQIVSATLAARFTGSYRWHESVMIGLGMLGRAELAFIVIDIAYTEHGLFNEVQFFILIIAAFLLNISVPLAINWWKPYYEGSSELKIAGITLSRKD